MRTLVRIVCVVVLLSLLPVYAVLADDTSLSVMANGMKWVNGNWSSEPISCRFTVIADGQEIGTLVTGDKLPLAPGEVTLVPCDLPEEWLVQDTTAITVEEGRNNLAPLVFFANSGLFSVSGAIPGDVYSLRNTEGEDAAVFNADAAGGYLSPTAVPTGFYYLFHDNTPVASGNVTPYLSAGSAVTEFIPDKAQSCYRLQVNSQGMEAVLIADDGSSLAGKVLTLPSGWRAADQEGICHKDDADYILITEDTSKVTISLTKITNNSAAYLTAPHGALSIKEIAMGGVPGFSSPVMTLGAAEAELPSSPQRKITGTGLAGTAILVQVNGAIYATRCAADGSFVINVPDADSADLYTVDGRTFQLPAGDVNINARKKSLIDTLLGLLIPEASAEGIPGQLQVHVFIDANKNGEFGRYEKDLPGVRIDLIDAADTVAASAVSDSLGSVSFTGLSSGNYRIEAALPDGWAFAPKGNKDIEIASIMGESSDTVQRSASFTFDASLGKVVRIGTMQMGAVSGQIWMDTNEDGIKDSSEPGVPDILVEMVGVKNGLIYTTRSTEDGSYAIDQIRPGSYHLRVTAPAGSSFTRHSAKGGANRSVITAEGKTTAYANVEIKAGQTLSRQYVGFISGASITGICFVDANYNGIYDEGEALYTGVRLELTRGNADKPLASAVVDEDGTLAFYGLRGSIYTIRALLKDNKHNYTKTVKGGNAFYNLPGRKEAYVQNITLADDESLHMDLGVYVPGSITGTAYLDSDFSGTISGKEQIVSGIIVSLIDSKGNVVDKTTTNGRGKYLFEGVVPGTYTIAAAAKRGYAYTKAGAGNVMLNTGNGNGESAPFELPMGANLSGLDLGMILPGKVQGVFFADENDNGLRDENEAGLAGTTVRLMSEEGEHFALALHSSGEYLFDSVMPGTYWVEFVLPENGIAAKQADGGNTLDASCKTASFSMTEGSSHTVPLCGGLTLGSVSGTVFADHDGSGTMNETDAVMPGAELTLIDADHQMQSITTGEDGRFCFEGIHPGSYRLSVICADGTVLSRTNGTELSLQPGLSEQEIDLSIPMGMCYQDQLLGMVVPASVSGRIWLDENNNGFIDDGEAAIGNIRLQIIDEDNGDVLTTVTSEEDGSFAANGLLPGTWTVSLKMVGTMTAPKAGDCTFVEKNGAMVQNGIRVEEGSDRNDLVLGLVRRITVSGKVSLDNGGKMTGLEGAEMYLMDANGSTLYTVITDNAGRWHFDDLMPGLFRLGVSLPEGQLVMEADDERLTSGQYVSIMTETDGRTGRSDVMDICMTETYSGLNIISVLPGKLGDKVWLDENGNGLQDYDEKGIPGVTVELMRGGQVFASTISNEYGYYRFNEVYPAEYILHVSAPEEIEPTVINTNYQGIVSVLMENGESTPITVVSGKTNDAADLGFRLIKEGVYPEGYGQAAGQIWTKGNE